MAALAGCGCGTLPGALSLPAAGLTAYAFGPIVALARFAAGCAVALRLRRHLEAHEAEPLAVLAGLVPYAFGGSLFAELLRTIPQTIAGSAVAGLVVGMLGGLLSPCALGAIAVAASLRHSAPWVAGGLLVTAGLAPPVVLGSPAILYADARLCYGLLVIAGAGLLALGGGGLVHPRLSAPVFAASLVGLVVAVRGAKRRAPLLAPLLAAAALVLGSPLPHYGLAETTSADAFAGQPVRFMGVIERRAGATLLVRFAITCCRADATAVALRLDRPVPLRDGDWATVEGVFRSSAQGLVVHVNRLVSSRAPRDLFLYR